MVLDSSFDYKQLMLIQFHPLNSEKRGLYSLRKALCVYGIVRGKLGRRMLMIMSSYKN